MVEHHYSHMYIYKQTYVLGRIYIRAICLSVERQCTRRYILRYIPRHYRVCPRQVDTRV